MQVFFSVGEPSGDHHAAALIRELRSRRPGLVCSGYGGPLMRAAGARIDFELTHLSVMGVGAVIPLLGRFTKLYRDTARLLRQRRPDAVVLVDYPGFNWWVAKAAWRANIPVIYYMPPQLWAWAAWRIRKVRRFIDLVLSPLPFEARWYEQRGIETRYVAHPFLDEAATRVVRNDPLDGQPGRRLVVLPGSRTQEVARNFPVMLSVMNRVFAQHPDVRFHVACHKATHQVACVDMLAANRAGLPATVHVGRTEEAIATCDMALMVSGSVSLELLRHATPAVVLYKCGWMTAAIGSLLTRCPFISLPNLIAQREVMPEFVFVGRDAVHAEGMANILRGWLASPERLAAVRDELVSIRNSLRTPGFNDASTKAATEVLGFVETRHASSVSGRPPVGVRAA